jgi:hypothetical protein
MKNFTGFHRFLVGLRGIVAALRGGMDRFPRTPATLVMSILCCVVLSLCLVRANALSFLLRPQNAQPPPIGQACLGEYCDSTYLILTPSKDPACPGDVVRFDASVTGGGSISCDPEVSCSGVPQNPPYQLDWSGPNGPILGCKDQTPCFVTIPANASGTFCVTVNAKWKVNRSCSINGQQKPTVVCDTGGSGQRCIQIGGIPMLSNPDVSPARVKNCATPAILDCTKVTFSISSNTSCPNNNYRKKWDFRDGHIAYTSGDSIDHTYESCNTTIPAQYEYKNCGNGTIELVKFYQATVTLQRAIGINGNTGETVWINTQGPLTLPKVYVIPLIEPGKPSGVTAQRVPNQNAISIKWSKSSSDVPAILAKYQLEYVIYRSLGPTGPMEPIATVAATGQNTPYEYIDRFNASNVGKNYCYQVTCRVKCDGSNLHVPK